MDGSSLRDLLGEILTSFDQLVSWKKIHGIATDILDDTMNRYATNSRSKINSNDEVNQRFVKYENITPDIVN